MNWHKFEMKVTPLNHRVCNVNYLSVCLNVFTVVTNMNLTRIYWHLYDSRLSPPVPVVSDTVLEILTASNILVFWIRVREYVVFTSSDVSSEDVLKFSTTSQLLYFKFALLQFKIDKKICDNTILTRFTVGITITDVWVSARVSFFFFLLPI